MKRLLLVLAACGDNTVVPDAAPIACSATFSGDFSDHVAMPSCAMLTGSTFALTVPAAMLTTPLTVSIDLGASPSPGAYSPGNVGAWDARGVTTIAQQGACVYAAGNTVVPTGSFMLVLDTLDPHGSLALTQYVLGFPSTDCGTNDTEHVAISF